MARQIQSSHEALLHWIWLTAVNVHPWVFTGFGTLLTYHLHDFLANVAVLDVWWFWGQSFNSAGAAAIVVPNWTTDATGIAADVAVGNRVVELEGPTRWKHVLDGNVFCVATQLPFIFQGDLQHWARNLTGCCGDDWLARLFFVPGLRGGTGCFRSIWWVGVKILFLTRNVRWVQMDVKYRRLWSGQSYPVTCTYQQLVSSNPF